MSGREHPRGRPQRALRPHHRFPADAPAARTGSLKGVPCLLTALLCLIMALGPAANLFPGELGAKGHRAVATVPFGPPVDALEGRSEAGESGCRGGGERETPREAVLPVPEQPGSPAQRAASPRHDPSRGIALLGTTSSPDTTAVDRYRTCVIRT